MKIFLILMIYSLNTYSMLCHSNSAELESSLIELSSSSSSIVSRSTCEKFKDIKKQDDFEKALRVMIQNQTNKVWKAKDRHEMGEMVNQCEPNADSKAFVINFAGTGAYNPRTHSLMAELIQCEDFQKVPSWLKNKTYYLLKSNLKKKKSAYTKWSGSQKGPMSMMLTDPELNEKARHFDFATFASEEVEILDNPKKLSNYSTRRLAEEMGRSYKNIPKGIENATKCIAKYYKKAQELNINPKLIIYSHSSGGRSAVKFLQNFVNSEIKTVQADLVITLDPVKEAHEAVKEVASQVSGNIGREVADYIPFVDTEQKPVNVWSRNQPHSLYKTSNSKRWINFYQQRDEDGLDMGIDFGIYGSPIHNADKNYFINDGLGDKAHGEITYHQRVLDITKKEILNLFE